MVTSTEITNTRVGDSSKTGTIVAKGKCPFCDRHAAFRQQGNGTDSEKHGAMVPVRCDGCHSIMTLIYGDETRVFPQPSIDGVDGIPEGIDQYYQEGLDCISAGAPNGAATLFRKTIHAIAIHYDIAEVDDSMGIYDMIKKLDEEGHINPKLRDSLLAVKDIGNDGAHINENEPDNDQILAIKELVDGVLQSTVIADQHIETAREAHPNDFKSE